MPKRVEFWRPVIGYGKLYQISNFGRVKARRIVRKSKGRRRRIQTARLLKVTVKRGIAVVVLRDEEGNRKWYQLKDLVADHWLPNRDYTKSIVLKNKKDPRDCRVWNLKECC